MMIATLALGLAEKLINTAIHTDPLAIKHLQMLSGKTLRIVIDKPELSVDVLFCDDHLRFEPVSQSIFEPQGMIIHPDCTLRVTDVGKLPTLMQNPSGNLPIKGDHQVLLQIKELISSFSPDVLDKLEHLIGKNATSYAHLAIQECSPIVMPILSSIKSLIIDGLTPNKANTDNLDSLIHQKKQELLRLQSDIEREQARLNDLQNQPSN
ncbi:SCP2 sterol-binding domain-containing protein [Moraxella sp. ZY200743]|uniref:SCP2 sterol-binding domain-containing protein n=1 Tax=Moraxella sp. ZY200743 TaxID=2911970 RepID=UPI003D7D3D0D